jgi:hypothetical protein
MRIRGIGWDPVCVIPACIALVIVDWLVAGEIPAWSLGHGHQGTIVGLLIYTAFILALLFWPSGDYESPNPTSGEMRLGRSGTATRFGHQRTFEGV